MKMQSCGASASLGRNWGITRKEVLILKPFGVEAINLILGFKRKAVLVEISAAFVKKEFGGE